MGDGQGQTFRGGEQSLWRGIDFSGVTVMIGVSTGQILPLLLEQVEQAGGLFIVIGYRPEELDLMASWLPRPSLVGLRARMRHLPLADESVDLLFVNGELRRTPTDRLPQVAAEFWRVLVPGGSLRISDILAPTEAPSDSAWAERNRIIQRLGAALNQPTALAVDLRQAAAALASTGFENLSVSILPGFPLGETWLQETVNAVRNMASRVPNAALRKEILETDLLRLAEAYAQGEQRAAQRFVLSGVKAGSLALDMRASFTEDDLRPRE